MPTNLTESDTWTANVQVPNTGEPADQNAWSIGAQPLANRLKYLLQRIMLAGTTITRAPASDVNTYSSFTLPDDATFGTDNVFKKIAEAAGNRSKWLKERILGASDTNIRVWFAAASPMVVAGSFDVTNLGLNLYPLLRHTGGTDAALIPIDHLLPRTGGKIKGLKLYVEGGTGHGSLPSNMPTVEIMGGAPGVGSAVFTSPSVLATATDASTSVAAYELVHSIDWTGSIDIDAANTFWLRVKGEVGGGALANQFRALAGYLEIAAA